ncbi:hypothetical protein B0I35DRAFT_418642 [Stachybotrys elegans]|uniref:Uncharacterized protein n=1 Tax=Stachybotrys elegans TaxID=80388 RepID=A0A8K0T827_9HYPO|nr:hypothetical protein B0I35DRAFT_418642 [Stachybotrys elegans]
MGCWRAQWSPILWHIDKTLLSSVLFSFWPWFSFPVLKKRQGFLHLRQRRAYRKRHGYALSVMLCSFDNDCRLMTALSPPVGDKEV